MFVGREKELAALERMYHKKSFQMAVVYGRRRIGKTSLLNEFIKDKNALYLPAEEVNDESLLCLPPTYKHITILIVVKK
jgi:AAA+ ATPase superfamily predicted ATPase